MGAPNASDKSEPDWSRIPPPLAFIVGPAQWYGWIQFGEQIDDFQQNAPEEQRSELKRLASRLWQERDAADGEALVEWVNGQSMTEHNEVARVYFLLVLLNELGYC